MDQIVIDESTHNMCQTPSNDNESRQVIAGVLKRLCVGTHYDDERREHTRYPIAVPVKVIPLWQDLSAAGASISMMTMNVSLGGAALIHKEECKASIVALNFGPAGVECAAIVLRVLRRSRIGAMHVIAGEFIGTWSQQSWFSRRK